VLKISVNIPTYNRAHLIRHALDSVLRQTYPNVEIVVLDDGSTDGTAAIVAEYGDRVKYFHQPNGGLGAARNAALERSTGDCIAFLDSDDEWLDFKLALQAEVLQRTPAGFLFTEFVILKDDGRRIRNGSRTWLTGQQQWSDIYPRQVSSVELGLDGRHAPHPFTAYSGRMYRQFLDEAFVLPTTAIVRRSAIGGLRFTERMTIFEDWEFFARLAGAHEGAFLDIETAVNRGHDSPDRLTRCGSLAKAECYAQMVERVWARDEAFAREYPEEVRRAASNGLLAVAREALRASRPDVTRQALERWRALPNPSGRSRAVAYSWLASVPFGKDLLTGAMLGRKVVQSIYRRDASSQVNPAA
jgi:glycosyltransferase involved in cell wall biosynthesis